MAMLARSARPKLDEPVGFASQARADLALAIKSRDALRTAASRIWEAGQSYGAKLQDLEQAVERANRALGAAKSAVTAGIIDNITQDAADVPKPDMIRVARTDWQVAKDELVAAQHAYGELEPRREKLNAEADAADKKVRIAAAAVMREHPVAKAIYAEHEQHFRDFLRTLGLIKWMDSNNVFGIRTESGFPADLSAYQTIEGVLRRSQQTPQNWATGYAKMPDGEEGGIIYGGGFMQAATAAWQAAYDALLTDANAPLPEVK